MNKFKSTLFLSAALCLLSSCVTTTTGGYAVQPSAERAVDDYIQLAIAYYDEGDLIGARRHANNALGLNDREANVYTILALISQREGDLDYAEQSFRRALSLDKTNSRAHNNYGAMLFGLERFDEAFDQLQAAADDPNYVGRSVAFEGLGRSALQLGREADAENAFTRALVLDANLHISALELALIKFKQQDWAAARQRFQQYMTTVDFFNVPHTPRALLAGIQIEGHFSNQEIVDNFSLILRTLYQESPEYQIHVRASNAN